MGYDKEKIRQIRGLILFVAGIVLLLLYSGNVLKGLGVLLDILVPFLAGGAIAFVLVSVSLTDFYRVPWPVWRDMAEIYGRKYMTHAELSRYEVPATAGFIKFLHGIESEVLGKEAAHDPTP